MRGQGVREVKAIRGRCKQGNEAGESKGLMRQGYEICESEVVKASQMRQVKASKVVE